MRLFKTFFIVTAFTVFLTIIQLSGYWILESLIVLLIIDFLVLTANIYLGDKNPIKNNPIDMEKEIVPRLQKIDNIEKTCTDIISKVSTSEEKLDKQGDNITYLLDRMAKKTMDLEEKINSFGNGLIDSMSSLRGKVEDLDKKEGESFSLGELVYVEEDKEDT